MEGAACNMVGSALLQCHEVTHHIHNLCGVQNSIYCLLRNHLLLVNVVIICILRELDVVLIDCLAHLP